MRYIDFIRQSDFKGRPMLAKKGFRYFELSDEAEDSDFEIITTETMEGNRVYERSIIFLFLAAVEKLYHGVRVNVEHSISKGLYIEFIKEFDDENIELKIKEKMQELVKRDIPINKTSMHPMEANELFKKVKYLDKVDLFETVPKDLTIDVYELDGVFGTFYGALTTHTGYLDLFDIVKYKKGYVLMYPSLSEPHSVPGFYAQDKLYKIFKETSEWDEILGVGKLGSLNKMIEKGEGKRLISVAEGLHEKKYAYIADRIVSKENIKIVLIAGPSSSGKTTSSKRLSVQLMVNGRSPHPIEMDNYFVNRVDTPLLPDGSYDYESLRAIDLDTFNRDIRDLLEGKAVTPPKFNFKTGEREPGTHTIQIPEDGIMIIEGIHALNPKLLSNIEDKYKFKIYVSALTQLNIDYHNRVSTTDVRKIRRMVRDHRTRGYSSDETLTLFKKVTKGEKENIFPFQEEADEMFNTTLVYELPVLKKHAVPLLLEIPEESPNYYEARRILTMLSFVTDLDDKYIPLNSVLREFIGDSFFD